MFHENYMDMRESSLNSADLEALKLGQLYMATLT